VADDFQLPQPFTVTRVVWWGFYYSIPSWQPPPAQETMRLRFYGARPGDGLPNDGAILYEQTIQNPPRLGTGNLVLVADAVNEYEYTVELPSPIAFTANTSYWLEVAQLGDPQSDFYWETGRILPHNGIAATNPLEPNWAFFGPPYDMAFQLITPEPSVFALVLFAAAVTTQLRDRRRSR
jgi:hypothetical protein